MPALVEVYDAVGRLGFSKSRARQYVQRLREEGEFASGAPGKSPDIQIDDFIALIIALAIGGTLRTVTNDVRAYRELTPGGVALEGAPFSIARAGSHLDAWASLALEGETELRRDQIEIVSGWPEIAIRNTASTICFQPVGSLSGHWQSAGHRRAVTINGAALADALLELFPRKN